MENINAVLNALNSDKTTGLLSEFYENHKRELSKKWRNLKLFSKYLKAFILDAYLSASEDTKAIILNNYKDGNFNTLIASKIIEDLNAAVATPGDCTANLEQGYFAQYAEFYEDPLFEKVSWDNYYIGEAIRNFCGFYTMDELTSKDVEKKHNYKFTEEELKTLEYASYVPYFNSCIHLLYDELDDETCELHCRYDLIDNPLIEKFAFHTGNDNDYFYVLANNRRLLRYYEGDIKVYPLTFDEFIEMVKLYFIKLYRKENPEEDIKNEEDELNDSSEIQEEDYDPDAFRNLCDTFMDILQEMIENPKYNELEVEEYCEQSEDYISPRNYEKYMSSAIECAWADIQTASDVYSVRMIMKAREDVKRIKKIILTYKL